MSDGAPRDPRGACVWHYRIRFERSNSGDRVVTQTKDESAVASSTALEVPLEIAIPIAKIVPWAIFGFVIMGLAYYFVGAEQGATSIFNGMGVHEFVHDARHLLGFPCH